MAIKKVGVIGAGSMGNGIAQVVALAGYEVYVQDVSQEALDRAKATIQGSLKKFVEKNKITQAEADRTLASLHWTTILEDVAPADLVIEAIFEDLELKKQTFARLDNLCGPETILASNTSSLPITAIAAATKRPQKVLGTHFMNPVPLMKGVEVIPGRLTSEEVTETVMEFLKSLGKVPVLAVDYPGFIASRVLDVMLNEAIYAVMDGNKPEDIDTAMKVCCNFPMGPLELIDLAGADILLNVMEIMTREMGDKYRPAPLLRQMVRAGHLGRKTGRGFCDYSK